jgi:hypothetical protein
VSTCYVVGIGILGPGLPNWPTARRIFSNEQAYRYELPPEPRPELLPPNERRRGARTVRWALAVAEEAIRTSGVAASEIASVFSSSSGDGETLHEICQTLATTTREVSPTRFHNSVHNAAAGYWSIASGSRRNSVTVCAHDASFGMGLVEASAVLHADQNNVLLVVYDLPYPEPLLSARPVTQALAIAVVLSRNEAAPRLARWRLSLSPPAGVKQTGGVWPEALDGNPTAAGLPLLAAVARRSPQRVHLRIGASQAMAVECAP